MTRAQANNLGRNDKRLRATQPNDPNAAFTNWRGNGTDRIFESSMHDESFTVRMLKKSTSFVLASLSTTVKGET